MSKLQLKVKVNESKIARMRPGQPVKIKFAALPRKTVTGQVRRVNAYPDPTSWTSGGVKEYGVIVTIDDPPDAIRLGMRALAEIDVSSDDE